MSGAAGGGGGGSGGGGVTIVLGRGDDGTVAHAPLQCQGLNMCVQAVRACVCVRVCACACVCGWWWWWRWEWGWGDLRVVRVQGR